MSASASVIAGKYELFEQLGKGAMGSVWRARRLDLSAWVAIKLIDPDLAGDPSRVRRFLREAHAAAGLRSPHVIQVLDYGVDGRAPYIVMELLEGETLAQRLRRVRRLSSGETASLVRQLGRALRRAHAGGVVHRDLKPDNIFLVENDDDWIAKVLDFGIAKLDTPFPAGDVDSTARGVLLGTPFYMSPEQAEGVKAVDRRTDIWSLGVIAFECLLGVRPFGGASLPSLLIAICRDPLPVPSRLGPVPPGFDAWFERACAREPNRRFDSARSAADALVRLCRACAETTGLVAAQLEAFADAEATVVDVPAPLGPPEVTQTFGPPSADETLRFPLTQPPAFRDGVVRPQPLVRSGWLALTGLTLIASACFIGGFVLLRSPQAPPGARTLAVAHAVRPSGAQLGLPPARPLPRPTPLIECVEPPVPISALPLELAPLPVRPPTAGPHPSAAVPSSLPSSPRSPIAATPEIVLEEEPSQDSILGF